MYCGNQIKEFHFLKLSCNFYVWNTVKVDTNISVFFFKYIRVVELSNTSYCVVLHILATSFCSDQINLN